MSLWPASGFGSRRGWMESSTDQILIDKFLKNQNIYSDLTRTVLYCSNRYNRLALFQGVPWKSVRNRYSADVCFETAPPFLKLVTFFRQNNTKFCLRIDRDFHPGISNSWLSLFFTSSKELNGSLTTNICSAGFTVTKYGTYYRNISFVLNFEG